MGAFWDFAVVVGPARAAFAGIRGHTRTAVITGIDAFTRRHIHLLPQLHTRTTALPKIAVLPVVLALVATL